MSWRRLPSSFEILNSTSAEVCPDAFILLPSFRKKEKCSIEFIGPFIFIFLTPKSPLPSFFLFIAQYGLDKTDDILHLCPRSSLLPSIDFSFPNSSDSARFQHFFRDHKFALESFATQYTQKFPDLSAIVSSQFPGAKSLTKVQIAILNISQNLHFQITNAESRRLECDEILADDSVFEACSVIDPKVGSLEPHQEGVLCCFQIFVNSGKFVFWMRNGHETMNWLLMLYYCKVKPKIRIEYEAKQIEVHAMVIQPDLNPDFVVRSKSPSFRPSIPYVEETEPSDGDEDVIYDIRKPGELEGSLRRLRERMQNYPPPEIYHSPDYQKLLVAGTNETSKFTEESGQRRLKNLIESLPEDDPISGLIEYEICSNERLVEEEISKLNPISKTTTDFSFIEFEKFEIEKDKFLESRRVVALTNQFVKLVVSFVQTEVKDHSDDVPTRNLIDAIAVTFLNGFIGLSLREAVTEMRGIEGMNELIAQIDMNSNPNAALFLAAKLLESGLLLSVFDWILEHDEWVKKYYCRSAYLADEGFLGDVMIHLMGILNDCLFVRVSVPTISTNSEKFDSKLSGFAYLDIEELFGQIGTTESVRIIVRQFEIGIKPKNTVWSAITAVVSGRQQQPFPKYWNSFAEAVKKNTQSALVRLTKAGDRELVGFVKDGLERQEIHIWFLYIALSRTIVKQFYYKDASIRDLMRAQYVAEKLLRYIESLEIEIP
jgi:hypothetical protein